MKRGQLLFFCFCLFMGSKAKSQSPSYADTAAAYFEELRMNSLQNQALWNYDIYAPVLLVNPRSREVFANFPDSLNVLQQTNRIYHGYLPRELNISNTSLRWNGRDWAMIMLPLSADRHRRLNLLSHELFHRAQKQLGFFPYNPENNHLDKKEGRIYLRLELQALIKAMNSNSPADRKKHIQDAIIFRKYRHSIYPGSDSTEALIEINEGICEYTGMMMSQRNVQQQQANFESRIRQFVQGKSYLRSFAYETIPVYGWLLQQIKPGWNKQVNKKTNLTEFFIHSFGIDLPARLSEKVAVISPGYDGAAITSQEELREEKTKQQIAFYTSKFFSEPHLSLPLENMNMSFDYLSIFPLEDKGTVYPTIRVTDNWGILDVKDGALISPDWKQITVGMPASITDTLIKGNGWTLELKKNYKLEKDKNGEAYKILKN